MADQKCVTHRFLNMRTVAVVTPTPSMQYETQKMSFIGSARGDSILFYCCIKNFKLFH